MRLIRLFTLTLNFSHRGFYRFLWPDYWAEVLRPGVMRGDSILWSSSSTEPRTPKQTPCFLCRLARLGRALEPGPRPWRPQRLAATGARHQGWQLYPDAGLSLVSGAKNGLWLAARVTPVSPWSQMRGDEMQPEIIKFLPVGGSVMHSTRPVLACNAPTWQYPLLHVFMASLNTMLQSTLSALMGAKCKMIQRINIVPRVIPCHSRWIEAMNFKTCICFLLTLSIFFFSNVCLLCSPTTITPTWEVSLRIVNKVHRKVWRSF